MYSLKELTICGLILTQLLAAIQCGVYDNTDNWILTDKTKNFPDNAILGGFDPYGFNNYVGRVSYVTSITSSILPARVVAETGAATYNTATTAYTATSYYVLVSNETLSYDWRRSYDGYREKNAVSVGTSDTNEKAYVCRARSDGALFIGTLYLTKRVCIIRYENLPLREFSKYEMLVRKSRQVSWLPIGV